ncbi:AAA family ATPase [Sedimenticola sp.]|uniref:AAA family ATPase n=1 Tax=Sedimenticola sp. TaxID=1940285 RepID=UPI003D1017BF
MANIHLIEGPVGAGKSTYAAKLSFEKRAVHIALDAWFSQLYSPDRPPGEFSPSWYIERKGRLLGVIWDHSCHLLDSGIDVILELGLIQRDERHRFYSLAELSGFPITLHVLDAPRDTRLERVQLRNIEQGETFSMVVPDSVFDMASDLWEPPNEEECNKYHAVFINMGG